MHGLAESRRHVGARGLADRFQRRSALAENDRAVAFAADIDRLLDLQLALFGAGPRGRFHSRFVGKLLVEALEDLFARDFRRHQPVRYVRELIVRIMPLAFRRSRQKLRPQIADAVAFLSRDQESFRKDAVRAHRRDEREEVGARDLIDFVERERRFRAAGLQRRDDGGGVGCRFRRSGEFGGRIDDKNDCVGAFKTVPRGGDHRPVKPPARAENAGRIDEDQLRLAIDENAADARARRLHLLGDDRHLGADESIDERRFTRVRRADDRDEG